MAKYDMRTDERFYQRRSIEDFTSGHEAVKRLYGILLRQPGIMDDDPERSESNALHVMNHAYYLCMLITEHSIEDRSGISSYIRETFDTSTGMRGNVLTTAIVLLALQGCYTEIHLLKEMYSITLNFKGLVPDVYADTVNRFHGMKLDFCGKKSRGLRGNTPRTRKMTREERRTMMGVFGSITAENMPQDKGGQPTLSEKIREAARMVESIGHDTQDIISRKDARIRELEARIRELGAELEEARQTISELQEKTVDDRINETINYKTLCEYMANEQMVSDDDAKAIRLALRELASNAPDFPTATLNKAITEALRVRRKSRQGTTIINNNKESQVFNGTINGASFDKKPSERA